MEGFDDPGIFFSDNFGGEDNQDANVINLQAIKKKFKDFIRTFNEDNFYYKYRWAFTIYSWKLSQFTLFSDTLKRNYLLGKFYLDVEFEDLAGFDENLADKLKKQPYK